MSCKCTDLDLPTEATYYLYRHIRLDKNEPFYIGIGTFSDKRRYERSRSKTGRSKFWKNIVNKTKYRIEILVESENENFINQKEIEFIKLYGRRDLKSGTLTNMTDGGEGSKGTIKTEKIRKKLRKAWKNPNLFKNARLTQFKKGRVANNSIMVINIETGIFYNSIIEAAKSSNMNNRTLSWILKKSQNNKTNFRII